MRHVLAASLLLFSVACDPEPEPSGDTEATGKATYQDASKSDSGADQEPAAVPPQDESDPMVVSIELRGTGTFDVSEPQCEADALSGAFNGSYEGTATIDDNGVYVAAMAESATELTTPSGCELPDVSIGLLTEVVVRGELTATSENCTTYCESKGRSYAEAECEGDSDQATCRAAAEASYEASCTQECSQSTHVIVAESSLGASAIGELALDGLSGNALGTVTVDLTFDHIEDSSGDEVDEAP